MVEILGISLESRNERDRKIVRTSFIGILTNLLLAFIKATVGIASNSVAITADAVNNLSDALSSVITIIGTKLAGKKPDKKHPLGYGRVEYLTAMIIGGIVLYAGITAMTESIDKIVNPEEASYSVVTLVILVIAIIAKLLLGRYFISVGKKFNSSPLVASGTDAMLDSLLTTSVFLSAVAFMVWSISLEAYVGILIAVMIIKTGVTIMWETLNDLLGRRTDKGFAEDIKSTICDREEVIGAYDLILHSYGPEKIIGSVHIEVPNTLSMERLDRLEREISKDVFYKHNVVMAAIGIYTTNSDEKSARMREEVTKTVLSHEGVIQVHGFHIYGEERLMVFDMVLDYSVHDRDALYNRICSEISDRYPDYMVYINLDADM